MRKNEPSFTDISEELKKMGYRFISGKMFLKNREIYNFTQELYKIQEIRPLLRSSDDAQKLKDTFIDMFQELGRWPELPIIAEAREILANNELKPLPMPLDEKQLIIINRLLIGKDEKFFVLTGIGGSGKSTFANMIVQIFENDVASLTLADLSDDFKLAQGINKRLVYADELNSDDMNNGVIKTLVSKQKINVNPKFEKNFNAVWQANLLFSCNRVPKLDLSDSGLIRRICYYSMNKKIENPDPTFKDRIYNHEDLVQVVAWALSMDTKDWEKLFEKETRDLLRKNNSVWICKSTSLSLTSHENYFDIAERKHLKPFSEPRWQEIKELLLDWNAEEGIDNEELPF